VDAGGCWWMLVDAGGCWWMLVDAGGCWWMLVDAGGRLDPHIILCLLRGAYFGHVVVRNNQK